MQNTAHSTIAAMFPIMGALIRTGVPEWLTQRAEATADHRPIEHDGTAPRTVKVDFR